MLGNPRYITTVKYPNNGKIKLVTMEIYIVSIALIYKNYVNTRFVSKTAWSFIYIHYTSQINLKQNILIIAGLFL